MKFIVAIKYDYNSYNEFRVLDVEHKSVTTFTFDSLIDDIRRENKQGREYGNVKLRYMNKSPYNITLDFMSKGCDNSRLPIIGTDINKNGVVILDIDGDYVSIANGEGKTCKVHMLQAIRNCELGKITLVNATITDSNRIVFRQNIRQ